MRGLKRTALGLATIALSAGVLAGCGSSGDTASTAAADAATTAALTKAEYVTAVNAICTKIDDTSNALESANLDDQAAVKSTLAELTANAKAGVQELTAITPPADLQAAHDELVSTSTESIALSGEILDEVEGAKVSTATLEAQAEKASALMDRQEAAAKELGLSNCFVGDAG